MGRWWRRKKHKWDKTYRVYFLFNLICSSLPPYFFQDNYIFLHSFISVCHYHFLFSLLLPKFTRLFFVVSFSSYLSIEILRGFSDKWMKFSLSKGALLLLPWLFPLTTTISAVVLLRFSNFALSEWPIQQNLELTWRQMLQTPPLS